MSTKVLVNLTEETKEKIQSEAESVGIPMSRYIPYILEQKLEEPSYPEKINYEEKTKISFLIPKEILDEIDKTAKEHGLSRSDYITLLLLQKKPVILTYSEEPAAELSNELRRVMQNINALAEICAESNGSLYEGEIQVYVKKLNELYEEMLKALKQIKKQGRKNYKQFYKEIYRKAEEENGNRKDNTDT